MRSLATSAMLTQLIQDYIDARPEDECTWITGVYAVTSVGALSNWNVAMNCRKQPGPKTNLSAFLDGLRAEYVVSFDDPDLLLEPVKAPRA